MHYRQLVFPFLFLLFHSLSGQVDLKVFAGGAKSSPAVSFWNNTNKDLKKKVEEFYGNISSPYLGVQLQNRLNKYISFNIDLQSCMKGQKAVDRNDFFYKAIYLDLIPTVDFNLSSA